jgi:hypothetical protein
LTAYLGNTNVLDVTSLRAELTDELITGAVVTAEIRDQSGATIVGPSLMSHVAGGTYRLFVPETTPFVASQHYTAYIDANGGPNVVGHWEFQFRPLARAVQDDA